MSAKTMNDRLLEESLQAKLNHGKVWWHIRPESVLSPVFPPGSAAASVGVEGGPVSGLGCVRGTAAPRPAPQRTEARSLEPGAALSDTAATY